MCIQLAAADRLEGPCGVVLVLVCGWQAPAATPIGVALGAILTARPFDIIVCTLGMGKNQAAADCMCCGGTVFLRGGKGRVDSAGGAQCWAGWVGARVGWEGGYFCTERVRA